MKLHIHPSLILWLSVLFYLSPHLVLPFLFAAAFHELGHALMLLKLKKPPLSITLSFSGAKMETPPMGYRAEGLAAAAGPICSLILSALWPLLPITAFYSMILGLVNLFPVPGLDGYRVIRSTLYLRYFPDSAESILRKISVIFSAFLTIGTSFLAAYFDLGLWPVILTLIFFIRAAGRQKEGQSAP